MNSNGIGGIAYLLAAVVALAAIAAVVAPAIITSPEGTGIDDPFAKGGGSGSSAEPPNFASNTGENTFLGMEIEDPFASGGGTVEGDPPNLGTYEGSDTFSGQEDNSEGVGDPFAVAEEETGQGTAQDVRLEFSHGSCGQNMEPGIIEARWIDSMFKVIANVEVTCNAEINGADFSVEGDKITLTYGHTPGTALCVCPRQLIFRLKNLDKKDYAVDVKSRVLPEEGERQEGQETEQQETAPPEAEQQEEEGSGAEPPDFGAPGDGSGFFG